MVGRGRGRNRSRRSSVSGGRPCRRSYFRYYCPDIVDPLRAIGIGSIIPRLHTVGISRSQSTNVIVIVVLFPVVVVQSKCRCQQYPQRVRGNYIVRPAITTICFFVLYVLAYPGVVPIHPGLNAPVLRPSELGSDIIDWALVDQSEPGSE